MRLYKPFRYSQHPCIRPNPATTTVTHMVVITMVTMANTSGIMTMANIVDIVTNAVFSQRTRQ
jgi:hypothetical protein